MIKSAETNPISHGSNLIFYYSHIQIKQLSVRQTRYAGARWHFYTKLNENLADGVWTVDKIC